MGGNPYILSYCFQFYTADAVTNWGLPGAEFKLMSELEDDAAHSGVSGPTGLVSFQVAPGRSYLLSQTSPPDGYVLNSSSYTVSINSAGQLFIDGYLTSFFIFPNLA